MEGISRDIMYAVFRTQKALYRLIREDAARVGVTEVQLIVLYTLLKTEHIRLNDLAEKLNLSNSNVSGTVDRLVGAGLVVREPSKQDRRAVILSLTEKGKETVSEAFGEQSVLRRRLRHIQELVSPEEIEQFLHLHEKIKAILLGEE
ncbi:MULTISPECIES: MarR family winged helix-turn-helix transcriptional regulator [Geobacillus]|uniref:MarR family transcriptional regulator n=1 Tax=Geobacillus zalihae TaxID=213419 RepID=A0A7H1RX63_9BACL|nr:MULTISPECIES: MarR family transcriptional regulator [Geobacillus]EPR27947.1 Transcriptional regulator, MarR family protein [Geobacillus sp. WSUCF1]OQP23823.1 MarR family transcriptional regulator [Geobacillus zalihae]QNU18852.1 MarR family transcriptional regulator [Geobacillus zalihae]